MTNKFVIRFILVSFISVVISRIIPHPPNFTSAIAIMFYLPALFGLRFITIGLSAFILSDLLLGIHNLVLFTWGSLLLIGLISKFFKKRYYRILGVSLSCFVFFVISNLGFWIFSNLYPLSFEGILECYIMALPFLQNSLTSSLLMSIIIELTLTMNKTKVFVKRINNNFVY